MRKEGKEWRFLLIFLFIVSDDTTHEYDVYPTNASIWVVKTAIIVIYLSIIHLAQSNPLLPSLGRRNLAQYYSFVSIVDCC